MGMVGGGPGAFIGTLHRCAAELDGAIRLVAGAFSSDPARSRTAGRAYGIDADRAYPDFATMLATEAQRGDGIDFVTIVTPNHLHFPVARAALDSGMAVMSDKPASATLQEAQLLAGIVANASRPYALSYTYTGYPLIREARTRIADGMLGTIRKATVDYTQGWLATAIETEGNKQAQWRINPAMAGEGGCIADIGVHAFNLLEFVTGHTVTSLCADLNALGAGRVLDDDCNILLRLDNGAPAVLIASQIATGARNGLHLRVHGSRASLDWCQEAPNRLVIDHHTHVSEIIHAGSPMLGPQARAATRLPVGHPEGYIEAFATLYHDFASVLSGGQAPMLPRIDQGVRSMAFVHSAVHASKHRLGWVDLVV